MASLIVCISEELKSKMDDKYKLFAELSKKTPGIDTENNPNRKPDWLDEQLMVNARWLANKYFASLFLAHFAGLLLLFQMETLLVPVFATTSHNTIEKLFKRYLDTFVHIKKWYSGDIFDKNSDGCRSIKKVNLMHRQVYKSVNPVSEGKTTMYMTQYDMVVTQWSSIGPVVLFPKQFGLHDVTDDELMAIVHYWRAIGFTLGIQDRFNCCCDTLEETKYICKLILDHDFMPPIKEGGEHCQLAIKMSSGLAKALNCFAPMLCFQGLLRYIYKTVLQVPVYVEVKNRKGYRNLVYMIQEMMQKSYWQWIFSYAIRFGLLCVSFRQKVIAEHFRKKYDHIDYMKEAKYCPYKQTVQ